jgi:biotin carboxylase
MPRILLLFPTSTYRAPDFLEAAGRLDVEVTVASEEDSTMSSFNPAGLLTLNFQRPERAAEAVRRFASKHPIDAVVAVDDQVALVGARISDALGFPHNPPQAVEAARNKHRMRQLLESGGVPTPRFQLRDLDDNRASIAVETVYPCVLKPLSLSASQGVIRADSPVGFIAAADRLDGILTAAFGSGESSKQFLVEEFIAGPEVAMEGLLLGGRFNVLTIFDKPDPLDGPFFEETIYLTPSRLPETQQHEIGECAERACRAIGLREGPVHVELRLSLNGPCVIEANPRSIGGLCSRVLRFGVGVSLEELIIRGALDRAYCLPTREDRSAGVMMIPIPRPGVLREVRGVSQVRATPHVEEATITARIGERLVPLPEGGKYLGFIFARGETPDTVETALRRAHSCLEFVIEDHEAAPNSAE